MLNQPFPTFLCICTLVGSLAAPAAADSRRPSLRESARTEAVRIAVADAKMTVVPPNYPQGLRPRLPKTREGRRAVLITLAGLGGLFTVAVAGALSAR